MKRILLIIVVLVAAMTSFAVSQPTHQHDTAVHQGIPDSAAVKHNVKSGIYHRPSCRHAKRCTKSCVPSTKAKAKAAGARACKVCRP